MKFVARVLVGLVIFSSIGLFANASTIYLPTASSSQYLPTVKIFPYSSSYDGDLVTESWGSGTLIDDKGTILTNNHVVQSLYDATKAFDAFQICLTKSNDTEDPVCEFTASLIARDPDTDLAILRMDGNSVGGTGLNFNFFLPYNNSSAYQIGDTTTIIGYPDTGGKTITYTSGLISGFITQGANTYIKTDADISFGNSGGTAVDKDGNFIGVPTYIVGSGSAEVIGYLFPVKNAVSWIGEHINDTITRNETLADQLRAKILSYVKANQSGVYKNEYPPYEISLVKGWKFASNLTALEQSMGTYGYYYAGQGLHIYDADSKSVMPLDIDIAVQDYAYDLTLDDVEYLYGFTSTDDSGDMIKKDVGGGTAFAPDPYGYDYTTERVNFNAVYPAIKYTQSYPDWSYANGEMVNFVTYYIPYGNRLMTIAYDYQDSDTEGGGKAKIESILDTFKVDMDKIESSVKTTVSGKNPVITVKNVLSDAYLSDYSYSYDGKDYFSVSFGKKRDYSFYVSVYSADYYDTTQVGNFMKFKADTLKNAEDWGTIVAKGSIKIDGHNAFFYTDSYDDGYGYGTRTTYVYIEGDDDSYIGVTYNNSEENFDKDMSEFKTVLRNISLDNGGEGTYTIPNFATGTAVSLGDIKNNVYEENIRALGRNSVFGEKLPAMFKPADNLSRKDFLMWAVKNLPYSSKLKTDFDTYSATFAPCNAASCVFADISGQSGETFDAMYFDFAFHKGVIKGREADGKRYFDPDKQIGMMEAFKIAFTLYGYETWEAPSFIPWYIPYLELAYKNEFMPYAVTSVDQMLNRGQGAYILDRAASYGSGYCGAYDCYYPMTEEVTYEY